MDLREFILQRIQDTLKAITPGASFTFPDSMPHAAITSDVGGRVYNKLRNDEEIDAAQCPSIEVVTSAKDTDTIEVDDQDCYHATLHGQAWGHHKSGNQGQGYDSDIRARLNALRADIVIALHAFPFWTGTGAGQAEPARAVVGPLEVTLTSQETDTTTNAPSGFTVVDFAVRYPFNKRFP
jgi:hypothetical protein